MVKAKKTPVREICSIIEKVLRQLCATGRATLCSIFSSFYFMMLNSVQINDFEIKSVAGGWVLLAIHFKQLFT